MKHSELSIFKDNGQKITCLTAYDASMAKLIDSAGVDIILIGDSLGMVIQGSENTRSVSMNDMLYHSAIVAKACNQSLVIADMPFHSYDNPKTALVNAKELIDSGAHMVKLEGGVENTDVINALVSNNIRVCGHLGLQPQLVVDSSGYKVQGRDEADAKSILDNAMLLESIGVSILVLECIPSNLAKLITKKLKIPTIGIGAGNGVDGQVLVLHDMLGMTHEFNPRFLRRYLNLYDEISGAVRNYVADVKSIEFPDNNEQY